VDVVGKFITYAI